MNKIFILLLLNFSFLYANSIKWYGNYDNAFYQARLTKKNLFIFLQDKNCPNCVKMYKKTFNNKKLIKLINKKYISVIVTKNQKSSYPIEMFYTLIYPSLFFVKYQDETLQYNAINGFISHKKLLNILSNN